MANIKSAKKRINIDGLLEMVLLVADMKEFEAMGYHPYSPEEYLHKYQETLEYMQKHNIGQ